MIVVDAEAACPACPVCDTSEAVSLAPNHNMRTWDVYHCENHFKMISFDTRPESQ